MILIREGEPGLLVVDFSEEPGFDLSADGLELQMGLSIQEAHGRTIVAQDNGQPGLVVSYISSALKSKGYRVRLDAALERRLSAYQEEQSQLDLIRRGKAR